MGTNAKSKFQLIHMVPQILDEILARSISNRSEGPYSLQPIGAYFAEQGWSWCGTASFPCAASPFILLTSGFILVASQHEEIRWRF